MTTRRRIEANAWSEHSYACYGVQVVGVPANSKIGRDKPTVSIIAADAHGGDAIGLVLTMENAKRLAVAIHTACDDATATQMEPHDQTIQP